MPSIVLDGLALAKQTETKLHARVQSIKQHILAPTLATILVGDDPASETYVNMKGNACQRIGLNSHKIKLPKNTTTQQLLKTIHQLNDDSSILGILLQHPTPAQIDERACFDAINIEKDVDGVTTQGFGLMSMNGPAYGSATPMGIMRLLQHYQIPIEGKHCVVVGRSAILGRPMAMMMLNANATVTICHSRTLQLKEHIMNADIIVGAVGKPQFIRTNWIKENAVVVDAGYHPGAVGDIELESISDKAYAYTPVPGGVGPMTINTLILQTILAGEKIIAQQQK